MSAAIVNCYQLVGSAWRNAIRLLAAEPLGRLSETQLLETFHDAPGDPIRLSVCAEIVRRTRLEQDEPQSEGVEGSIAVLPFGHQCGEFCARDAAMPRRPAAKQEDLSCFERGGVEDDECTHLDVRDDGHGVGECIDCHVLLDAATREPLAFVPTELAQENERLRAEIVLHRERGEAWKAVAELALCQEEFTAALMAAISRAGAADDAVKEVATGVAFKNELENERLRADLTKERARGDAWEEYAKEVEAYAFDAWGFRGGEDLIALRNAALASSRKS